MIACDRLVTDCDLDLYMTFDNLKVGELQAQYLVDHLPKGKKTRIVRIYGAKTDHNALSSASWPVTMSSMRFVTIQRMDAAISCARMFRVTAKKHQTA